MTGFLDLFVAKGAHASENNCLYRNNGNSNSWLKVKLLGTVSNRSAIGAKVRVKAMIGGKTFWQLREISSGSGFAQNALEAHFGLGNATNIDTLRIEWPSGITQEFHDVGTNQLWTQVEPGKSGPLGNWSLIKPSHPRIALYAIAYGNGQFVAVRFPGAILTSGDDVNWAQRQSGTTDALTGIYFANGQFVVVGKRKTILTSANGVDWVQGQMERQNYFYGYGVTYGSGKFVAVGDAIIASPDGTNWVEQSWWAFGWGNAVAYGSGKFVAVGVDPPVQTSADGLNWVRQVTLPHYQLQGIAYGNAQFVAVDLMESRPPTMQ
jgi:hypothetical protein